MGCSSSKLDDLPAVALCRERCRFLNEAIKQRFAFAEAHVAYTASLKLFGQSLNNFVDHDFGASPGAALPPSPPSPNKLKSKAMDPVKVGLSSPKKDFVSHRHSHSNSGSHLHFHSDSDEDDSGGSLHHSDHSSPLHDDGEYLQQNYPNYGAFETGSFPGGFMHMNFMKKQPTPSIVYEQRPRNPEIVYMGESSSSSSSYPYSYGSNINNNPSSSSYPYPGYQNSGGFSSYSSYSGTGYESSLQPSSTEKPPPPPPSPRRTSAWDFLNPFGSYENYYRPYTPSGDLREVREAEGIPDLEDENYQHEVVKEVHGGQKFVDSGGYSKSPVENEARNVVSTEPEASLYQTRPSVGVENDRVEYEVHVVDNKVVSDERAAEDRGKGSKGPPSPRNVFEVVNELQAQFVRASESGNEIAKLLEVGTLPYQRKHVSKMLHVVTPSISLVSSQPSTSRTDESSSPADNTDPAFLELNEELARKQKNLSSTLQKLYMWEKKLYNEVKAEEKMRVAYDRKCHKLKRLDERGAEANKIDSTRHMIRSLSTKIRIAIQVVDKISVTINKIRDEELWPLLNELIEGLNILWKRMLECHRSQCQVIREAKSLGSIGSGKKLSDDHLKATLQLEHELISWTVRFASWIGAQKGYVRALNNWLLKCLYYEPEVTDDGVAPFSPSRVGAPPIFVICNQWSQSMDRISEREVVDSMRIFAMSMFQLWEQDKSEMHRRMMANKDLERKAKNLDREDQKLHKEIQALDKIIIMVSGDGNGLSVAGQAVYQSDTSNISLQGCLQRIFEAMERFSSESSKAYEELLQRVKERFAQECERVS
ncbi:kinase family protein [Hibiscus syriacus]|uniref:Kinase family protein n=1 Tax=Hibiscus syriacus TaxID=106335 RepID=A0A6A3BUT0_HIBSY|nr:protein ROLLING AND ERECT LEAF 2-like [Hibiscus syriacus]KAE8719158.1 kinase family protein [Hibiscus syriacus]